MSSPPPTSTGPRLAPVLAAWPAMAAATAVLLALPVPLVSPLLWALLHEGVRPVGPGRAPGSPVLPWFFLGFHFRRLFPMAWSVAQLALTSTTLGALLPLGLIMLLRR